MVVPAIAVVTVIPKTGEKIPEGHVITLKFASNDLNNENEKPMIEGRAEVQGRRSKSESHMYVAKIEVEDNFGEIGAVIVEIPENLDEKYIETVSLSFSPSRSTIFSCNSWVQPKNLIPDPRIFFSTKSYLPARTPPGLVKLRNEDLENLRGKRGEKDGEEEEDMNERHAFERIYNYDVYNDLGNTDEDMELKRPVLGGPGRPYPRRCRTGRPPSARDPQSEKRSSAPFYVPRDEAFSEVKEALFTKKPVTPTPTLLGTKSFDNFAQIDLMFGDGIKPPNPPPPPPQPQPQPQPSGKSSVFGLVEGIDYLPPVSYENPYASDDHNDDEKKKPSDDYDDKDPKSDDKEKEKKIQPPAVIKFEPPECMKRDKFIWLSDSEFARHTLAGLNPYGIQRVMSWPLTSQLDENVYGPKQSILDSNLINKLIGITGMTAETAVRDKKLYILDYHDTLMQFVKKVRSVKGTTLYGSRTLFFLNSDDNTLRPLAIELSRPPMNGKKQWKQGFSPSTTDATQNWLWRLAKSHVLAHDSCFHELIVHWLRTHCAVEPYIIATNRQLSTMHPIYRLLHPHFRFTIRINSNAREILVNGGGIIESTFSTAKYSMELSSLVYEKDWKFELQALPEDLIHRGMAEREGNGVKLNIQDYPFANDGLLLWDALKEWVSQYVRHYYPGDQAGDVLVQNDKEIQKWWTEIKEKGHPDKKGEGMWPNLTTREELINIVTTIAWVACGHHSAVNFGQYAHAAYFPGRPSIARTNMPTEDSDQHPEDFLAKPETALLQSFPSVAQAARVATAMWILSVHSRDEEYLGEKMEPSWRDDPAIAKAFDEFKTRLEKLESTIDERNGDSKLKNRRGAGRVPYEAFKPSSNQGVTGKGVPYSIST